jgi:hypothetical protein
MPVPDFAPAPARPSVSVRIGICVYVSALRGFFPHHFDHQPVSHKAGVTVMRETRREGGKIIAKREKSLKGSELHPVSPSL